MLGGYGASREEEGMEMEIGMGMCVPRLGELGSVVEVVKEMKEKMIAIWAPV